MNGGGEVTVDLAASGRAHPLTRARNLGQRGR